MKLFISAGEPSGDLHGANLVRMLRQLDPSMECVGFGGEQMSEAGCKLLYPLCTLAVMWFVRVLANAPVFLGLLSRADRYFRHQRPDAVVLIDYPGFHWWLARRAHFHGIPVYYFVPPQLWGWAGWRVRKMRRWVGHVLCTLPFEEEWYRQRGVSAHYVGHPYFDELRQQKLDESFLKAQRSHSGNIVGLLPGSRNQEIERNLPTLVRTASLLASQRPGTRFLVACFKASQRAYVDAHLNGLDLPIETHVGRTPEIIELSRCCVAVSGSVGLELLYRKKPTVVAYRIGKIDLRVARFFKTVPYISLVNLLAGKELYPEFLTDHCEADKIAAHLHRWLADPSAYRDLVSELTALRAQVAQPGACFRAAQFLLDAVRPIAQAA